MGAAPRNLGPAQAGQGANAAPVEESRERTLAESINDEADRAELDAQNQPTGDVGDQPAANDGAALDPTAARFDALEKRFEEREAEHKMERQMLLGALNRQSAPPIVRVEQPPPAEPKPAPPSEEQLLESLKTNPIGTIRQLIAETTTNVTRATEERLRKEIGDTNQNTQRAVAFQDRMRQGALAYQQQFSDVLESDLGKQFDTECGQEIVSMYGDNWREHIQPEGPINAASRVYTRWVRSGKLPASAGGTNGHAPANGATSGLREIIRRPPSGDRPTGSSGAPRGGKGEPTSIGELGLSAAEERAARRVASEWGLDERTWVRNYLAAKQDNPNYGNG